MRGFRVEGSSGFPTRNREILRLASSAAPTAEPRDSSLPGLRSPGRRRFIPRSRASTCRARAAVALPRSMRTARGTSLAGSVGGGSIAVFATIPIASPHLQPGSTPPLRNRAGQAGEVGRAAGHGMAHKSPQPSPLPRHGRGRPWGGRAAPTPQGRHPQEQPVPPVEAEARLEETGIRKIGRSTGAGGASGQSGACGRIGPVRRPRRPRRPIRLFPSARGLSWASTGRIGNSPPIPAFIPRGPVALFSPSRPPSPTLPLKNNGNEPATARSLHEPYGVQGLENDAPRTRHNSGEDPRCLQGAANERHAPPRFQGQQGCPPRSQPRHPSTHREVAHPPTSGPLPCSAAEAARPVDAGSRNKSGIANTLGRPSAFPLPPFFPKHPPPPPSLNPQDNLPLPAPDPPLSTPPQQPLSPPTVPPPNS